MDEPASSPAVNEFFNRRIVFTDDTEAWGQDDYWASPLETLDKGAGDCEDYAIAKYFSLIAAGVPVARLRLVYVRATIGGPAGRCRRTWCWPTTRSPAAEPLILDNLISEVRPASRRPDLDAGVQLQQRRPVAGHGRAAAGDPIARLSRWREVLAKARAEGFHMTCVRATAKSTCP